MARIALGTTTPAGAATTSPESADLLLDASVFIAAEAGRSLARRPAGQARVSVVTLAELRLGVLRSDGALRELREATLSLARRFVPLAVTEPVADELAGLLAKLRASERRARAFDCFVAATALAHQLIVVTQDTGFETLQAAEPRLAVEFV
jgi:predicted nucleic acid-binding protein